MEAVAHGQQAYHLNNELHTGQVYMFRGLGFESAEIPPRFGQTIPTKFYIIMHYRTQVHRPGPDVDIPRLPSRYMDFSDVARLKNKMLTGPLQNKVLIRSHILLFLD
jgi:hypothetical protein